MDVSVWCIIFYVVFLSVICLTQIVSRLNMN